MMEVESTESDQVLLERYVTGRSDQAFASLRRRYSSLVYSSCLRETRNPTQAEDAAQGVFLLLSQRAASLQRHPSLAGWLYQASKLVSRNLMKSERRRTSYEMEAIMQSSTDSDSNLLWSQIEPHFHDALDRLKPDDREAMLLRFVQGLSLAQVGDSLKVSENTARMRVSRSLDRVRKFLERVGVAVTVGTLTLLLSERSAVAAPLAVSSGRPGIPPSVKLAARGAAANLLVLALWKPVLVSLILLVAGVGAFQQARRPSGGSLMPIAAQTQAFNEMSGDWSGQLEYADDVTGARMGFPTTVTIGSTPDGFKMTARYMGTDRIDVTDIKREPDGTFTIGNGGEMSSHKLDGQYRLSQANPGELEFEGDSIQLLARVRLRVTWSPSTLTIQEVVRKVGATEFVFRNQFDLKRNPG